ncbi:hypothetical protein CORC01_04747 [Colletotrichum orchidophilum]|uniref:SET domain-containing protein n=1 Tax=Colletotrichum orchidophilum TaxID=1209926 RepID=A0A1G4BET7_9PEZI|nr:uncharacterized protein CORC01_04747 [Colletotrichum orchidophilum]OHE99846.1 hypothetical protein CORC01_04747 [Colletotrichum orchidophilum]
MGAIKKKGMARDDFNVGIEVLVKNKARIEMVVLNAILDLTVDAEAVNHIMNMREPLEKLKVEFLEFQSMINKALPPLPFSEMTWKSIYVAQGIIVDGELSDDDEEEEEEDDDDYSDAGYYTQCSTSSAASSLVSDVPIQGFGSIEDPIVLSPVELPLLTTYEDNHSSKERLSIFSNEFFEIRRSPTAGWGAFATKKLHRGEQIMVEKALYHAFYSDVTKAVKSLPQKERLVANDMSAFSNQEGETKEEAIWSTNAFTARLTSKDGTQKNVPGLFAIAGRFNHSCSPKIDYKFRTDKELLVFTVRDWEIEKGEELTISYGQVPSVLWYKYGFICECGYCRKFDPKQSEWS